MRRGKQTYALTVPWRPVIHVINMIIQLTMPSYMSNSNGFLSQPSCATEDKSAEFNTDFSNWLPRYQKPAQPCAYCRSKSLECFIYNSGPEQSGCCSPCNALFRPCSFSNPDTTVKQRTALDTLDIVTENDTRDFGGLTGRKQMRSLGHMGPIEDEDEGQQKKGAAAARFPRAATKVLKDWMIAHIDHPYPVEEEKETLVKQTGLTLGQISNWMANTRRRQKARPKRSSSPSIRPSTKVIDIPVGKTWESMSKYKNPQSSICHETLASAFAGKFLDLRVGNEYLATRVPTVAFQRVNCSG